MRPVPATGCRIIGASASAWAFPLSCGLLAPAAGGLGAAATAWFCDGPAGTVHGLGPIAAPIHDAEHSIRNAAGAAQRRLPRDT